MKQAIIFHGTSETKDSFWFPYIIREMETKGYNVSFPELPNADDPDIARWLPAALQREYTEDTILLAHSAGCALVLSVLEHIQVKVKQAVLVSGYARPLPGEDVNKVIQKRYDWEKIAEHVEELILLNADNDPWGCTDSEGRYILDNIGKGRLIIMKGEGHMGSDRFNQPYREFPFLSRLIVE